MTINIKTIMQINKHKVKYIMHVYPNYFFSLLYIRMNGKSINFDNKRKATSTTKTKKYLI